MKNFKKGLSFAVALIMALQVFGFVPYAEMVEITKEVDLGAPVVVYNTAWVSADPLTDKDTASGMIFDRRRTADTWTSVVVYDAGEGETFSFNELKLVGTGVHFFGGNDESILGIEETIDTSVNYSQNIDELAALYNLESYAHLGGERYSEDSIRLDAPASCRFLVVAIYDGWTNANIGEIYVNNVTQEEVLGERTVTFGDNIKVKAQGEEIASGDIVLEGTELVIEPVLENGDVLDTILVNGEPIEGNTYVAALDDIEITFVTVEKRTVTFGENISVTVDGEEIASGDGVTSGKELAIEVNVPEGEKLNEILVNGSAIQNNTYSVGYEDIEITYTTVEKRTVTFGENVKVTVDGEEIQNGAEIFVGAVLEITPVLAENQALKAILVNGNEISGSSFTVEGEDVTVEITFTEVEAGTAALGRPVHVFNLPWGNADLLTDGDTNTGLTIRRSDTSPFWVTAFVYDAGENRTFEFNRIELVSGTGVKIYGANSAVNGDCSLLDIAGTIPQQDYSAADDTSFGENLGLTLLADMANNHKNFKETQSYRYIVAQLYNGWPNASVNELTLKLLDPEELLEERTVTFGENVKVSVDGVEINSGDKVKETKVLKIVPQLNEGEKLSSVIVNGAAIEGDEYVVGESDVTIEFTLVQDRAVTFGENLKVSVNGEEINSGDKVPEGTELKIVPILPENSVLEAITVNNAAIEGDTYVVGGEDAAISFTYIMKRTVTFGEKVTVSADGAAVESGAMLLQGSVINIAPVLGEEEILDQILVNGTAISGNEYTIGDSDVEITVTVVTLDPNAVPLGTATYVYNIPTGNVADITDGKSSTTLVITRRDNGGVGPTWISAIVYDAGEGKTFDFNRIDVESWQNVQFYGTNEAVNGEFNLLDIDGTINKENDYSQNNTLAADFGLTELGNIRNSSKSFNDMQSFRYFVVAVTEGWPNAGITEVKLSDKITCAELGEVIYAGGEYALKSGQWSASGFNAEYSVTDKDFGIVSGTTAPLTLWGWIGGSNTQATSGAGTVSFKLRSDRESYVDVKIVGNTKRDERDFAVWVEGENGETSSGSVLTADGGQSLGNLNMYVIKNVKVFPGINNIVIGSQQFEYAPDYIMSVVVDKSDSFLKPGDIKYASGNEYNFGTLATEDNIIKEFFPDKKQGDGLGVLPMGGAFSAEALTQGGTYTLMVLSDSGEVTLNVGETNYTGETYSADYASEGGLYASVIRNVVLPDGISELAVSAKDIVAVKLIPVRANKVTFGDDITVVAGGKIVNSGDTVADGTSLGISAFSSEGMILDKILVNGNEITGGSYFVFGEDVEIKAEYIDMMYVTVTFDDNVAVMFDGGLLNSGDKVRGDGALRFSSRASAGIRAVYSVNGQEIEGNTYTLNKQDIHVSVTLTPYDLIYADEYEITLSEETETELIYLLPKTGDFGSDIEWAIKSGAGVIEEYDDNNYALKVATEANFEKQTIELMASVTIGGVTYSVEKQVEAESKAIRDIGGRTFYIRAIGDSEADFVVNDGQLAISGKGGDLWQAPDSFGYLYTKTSDEDFTISVKVDSIEGTNQWRRTGLMFRESSDSGARFVMLSFGANNGARLEFAYRNDNNGRAIEVSRIWSDLCYIKLEKKGDEFNAYYSADAVEYTKINSEPIVFNMADEYAAGLFSESESGYTYFSRFELNGEDVFAADSVENLSYVPANGKIKLNWTEPAEYSTKSFETVEITADCGDENPIVVEVNKGVGEAIVEGLNNDIAYTVSVKAKTAELCTGGENNASPYKAESTAAVISAMAFDAAEYAANVPKLDVSLRNTVMAGERNRVSLAFAEEIPASAFKLKVSLPSGTAISETGMSLAEGVKAEIVEGGLEISYDGKIGVKEIGTFYVTAEATGSYNMEISGTASFMSFEDGLLTTENAALASQKVDVVDVSYVTLTFDNRITVTINGESVSSGATVRGDSELVLSCSVPENAELTYIVNGERTSESTVTIDNTDTYIGCEITPYDVNFVRNYELSQRTETEAGVLFDLPRTGEYGSRITWALKDTAKGDAITSADYEKDLLTVNMSQNNYVDRAVELIATVRFNNVDYVVEKTAYAKTGILHELAGENFFLRQIGQDDQSTASFEIKNNQIVLTGYGTDLWTTPDSFGYLYKKTSDEDFTISVKVDRQEGGNQWRRSGIMFRQSDSENEKMVMLSVGAWNGAALEYAYRIGTAGSASQAARNNSHANTIWIKLEKKGNKFYAYCSDDGEEFTLVSENPVSVTMKGEYLVGIFSETDSGSTYFSRLELNGSDVFVADGITNAAAIPSEGKIRVTWEDPYDYSTRAFEDIVVTATDPRGKVSTINVPKGTQEAVFENLTNGQMYTIEISARSSALCTESTENGASTYRAVSAPVKLTAFPVDMAYLAATKPVAVMTASKANVAVGQSENITVAFEEMQPVYKMDLSIDVPSELKVRERDIVLSDVLKNAGATAEVKDNKISVKYEASGADGILYVTDLFSFVLSGEKAGSYTLETKGTVSYYSFEQGELAAEMNSKSSVSFRVQSASAGSGSSGGSGGSGSHKGGSTIGGTTNIPYIEGNKVEKAPEATAIFVDKADIPSWAEQSIGRLVERKVISGIEQPEGLMFLPNADVTREQFVKLCVEAFVGVDANASCSFGDVDANAWYYPYIATMVQKGIINGYTDGNFGIGDNISRQDMAVIIYNLYQKGYIRLLSGSVTSFADSGEIAPYALEAVTVLRAAGIINGFENNNYAPKQNVSRAQAAKVIFGCMN